MPRKGVSAKHFQEAMHLALRVVEPPGAGPAVRAAVDRLVAVGVDDAAQFAGQQFGELVPGHGDELVGAARRAGPGPVASQPRRTAGPAIRDRCRIEPGRLPSSGDGSVSPSSGVTAAMSPDSTSAVNAPQCVRLVGPWAMTASLGAVTRQRPPGIPTIRLGGIWSCRNSPYHPSGGQPWAVVVVKYERTLFEPEHDLFRESYRAFLDRHVAPFHDQWEKDKIVDRGVWLEAGKQGFLGMAVPEEYGGGGNPDFRYNVDHHRGDHRGPLQRPRLRRCTTTSIAPYLLRLATEEQKQRWLPRFCTGELITAIAMTEPGTGSDLQGIKTRAVKQGDHYVLNGAKTFITNGINADLVIVVACTDPDKGAQGFSLLVVERGMEGFERGRQLDKIGLDAQDTAELSFTDVKVPAENLLGEEGMGFIYLMQNLPQERISIA